LPVSVPGKFILQLTSLPDGGVGDLDIEGDDEATDMGGVGISTVGIGTIDSGTTDIGLRW
jgi:hypothetical protein